jgi:hypothetical protein
MLSRCRLAKLDSALVVVVRAVKDDAGEAALWRLEYCGAQAQVSRMCDSWSHDTQV